MHAAEAALDMRDDESRVRTLLLQFGAKTGAGDVLGKLCDLQSFLKQIGCEDTDGFLRAWAAKGAGGPPQAAELRLNEVEALRATITDQVTSVSRYAAQLAELEATQRDIVLGTHGDAQWMNDELFIGGGRGVDDQIGKMELAILHAKRAQRHASHLLMNLTPQIFADLTPELIRTRKEYNDEYQKLLEEHGLELDALQALLEEFSSESCWRPQTLLTETSSSDRDRRFLEFLFRDAESARPEFRAEIHRIAELVNQELSGEVEPVVAPLKSVGRALAKVFRPGPDFGNYAQVTDLVRGTFSCRTLRAAVACVRHLRDSKVFELVFADNRLARGFDPNPRGGYRERVVLCLVRVPLERGGVPTHVCEVQLNLVPLLAIKEGGGHAVYERARAVGAFDWRVNTYVGQYTDSTVDLVRQGAIVDLTFAMKSVDVERLRESIGSATCQLRRLALMKIGGGGIGVVNKLLPSAGPGLVDTLTELWLTDCAVSPGSSLSAFSSLQRLQVFRLLYSDKVSHLGDTWEGTIGALSDLTRLYKLSIYHCKKIAGSLDDLGGLKALHKLRLKNLPLVTGDASRFADTTTGYSTFHLELYGCGKVTGNVADMVTRLRESSKNAKILIKCCEMMGEDVDIDTRARC